MGAPHGSSCEAVNDGSAFAGETGSTPGASKTFQPQACGFISMTVISPGSASFCIMWLSKDKWKCPPLSRSQNIWELRPLFPVRTNELRLMKTKILRNTFLTLGMIFGLAIAARAQNLYVSLQGPLTNSGGSISEYTPTGVQETFATAPFPRGVAFDNSGRPVTLNFILTDGPDGWVILDVESPHDSLRMFLAQYRN